MLVGLVTVPLALSYLGKEQFGLWAVITSFLAWVTLFDFGVVNGLVNSISEAHGRDDPESASSYVSTAFFLLIAIAMVGAAVFALAMPFVPWNVVFAARGLVENKVIKWSVVAAVAPVLISMPLSIVRQIYAGYQKTYIGNFFTVIGSLATMGSLWLAVRFKASLPIFIAALGGASMGVLLLNLTYVSAVEMPWLRPMWNRVSRQALKRLSDTSLPLFLYQIGALLVNQTQLIILAHRCSLDTVAEYSIVMKLYLSLISLISLSTNSFIPPFREAFERGDKAWMRLSFRRMVILRMSLAAAFALLMGIVGNWLLETWLRRGDIQFGTEVWIALGISMLSATWGTAFFDFLTIMDKIWIQVGLVMVNGFVTVLLTFVLSPRFGVLGAIVSVSFTATVVMTWLIPLVALPTLKVD